MRLRKRGMAPLAVAAAAGACALAVLAPTASASTQSQWFDNVMVSVPANLQEVQSVELTNVNVCIPRITPGQFASFNHNALKGANYGFAVFDRPNCAVNPDSELPFQADGYISEQAPAPGQPGSQWSNWWVSLP